MDYTILPCHVNYALSYFLNNQTFTRLPLKNTDLIYFSDKINFDMYGKYFIEPDALNLCLLNPQFNIEMWLLNGYPKTILDLKKVENFLTKHKKELSKNKLFIKLYYKTTVFAEYFPDIINWNIWLKNIKPCSKTTKLILENIHQMDQRIIAKRKLVPWDILLKHSGKFDFKFFHTTDTKVLNKLKCYVNWTAIIRNLPIQHWSLSFIEEHMDFIDFNEISHKKLLPMSFINRHIDKFDFNILCQTQNLSIDFLKDHKNQLNDENLYYLQKNKYFNKNDTIQITKTHNSWFIIELPYIARVKHVNFCMLEE